MSFNSAKIEDFNKHVSREAIRHSYHSLHLEFNKIDTRAVENELRWLDWIFWGGYLPRLSIDYVAMSKDREKRLPQLYYIKMKISYDLGFSAIGVAMAT